MIAAGAGQVENDTAETELSEMSLHIILQVSLFEILTFHGCLFGVHPFTAEKLKESYKDSLEWWSDAASAGSDGSTGSQTLQRSGAYLPKTDIR